MLVNLLGVSIAAMGLVVVEVLTDAKRLIAVLVLYVVVSLSAAAVGRRRDVLLFNTFLAIGVAVLGFASYGAALLPGIAILTWGCFLSERRSSRAFETMAALIGFAGGLWLVIAVAIVERTNS
ncbi:MAG: hypothetical protein IT301_11350 [Dehalococcoidia bacterium]|nr:hypothetical protein [Dehalococcoidia bacterium]